MPKLDFEGKRDRWIGYDTATHDELLDEFSKIEKVKQQLKAESLNNNERIRQETESKSDRSAWFYPLESTFNPLHMLSVR